MKQERLKSLWAEVRELNQRLAAVHREIQRVELGLPEPLVFDKDWVPPYLRKVDVHYDGRRRNPRRARAR